MGLIAARTAAHTTYTYIHTYTRNYTILTLTYTHIYILHIYYIYKRERESIAVRSCFALLARDKVLGNTHTHTRQS